MINFIEVCNYNSGTKIDEKTSNVFLLNTCQRTLMVGVSSHPEFQTLKTRYISDQINNCKSSKAYSFLLETICGLQSKLACESEIICQFKEAYQNFINQENPNSLIIKFMEKLFQDAKMVRKNHLNTVHQTSYSSITRTIIKQYSSSKRILILGTGQLADDLAKTLMKRHDVYITGRNNERLAHFSDHYHCHILSWQSKQLIQEFSVIINTIGSKLNFINQDFFKNWNKLQKEHLFIDLAASSWLPIGDINKIFKKNSLFTLEDIFEVAKEENLKKESTIYNARKSINQIVEKRKYTFNHTNYHSWDDLAIC